MFTQLLQTNIRIFFARNSNYHCCLYVDKKNEKFLAFFLSLNFFQFFFHFQSFSNTFTIIFVLKKSIYFAQLINLSDHFSDIIIPDVHSVPKLTISVSEVKDMKKIPSSFLKLFYRSFRGEKLLKKKIFLNIFSLFYFWGNFEYQQFLLVGIEIWLNFFQIFHGEVIFKTDLVL